MTLEIQDLIEPLNTLTKKEAVLLADYLNNEMEKSRRGKIRDHHLELNDHLKKYRKTYKAVRIYLTSIYGTKRTKRILKVLNCPFEDLPLHMGNTFFMTRAILKWRLQICK